MIMIDIDMALLLHHLPRHVSSKMLLCSLIIYYESAFLHVS